MLRKIVDTFWLLLPAIVPSWRFFDEIAPSPRIEYCHFEKEVDKAEWQEFRPRPAHVSFPTMLTRMLFNPDWNESLFLMSCAERLMANPTDHSVNEISDRIRGDLRESSDKVGEHYRFRLAFLHRHEGSIHREVTYLSPVFEVSEGGPGDV